MFHFHFHLQVPFDYCERPPSISHGFMSTPPENVYRILFEVMYECHPGKTFCKYMPICTKNDKLCLTEKKIIRI
jgi:hypothetical protein